MPGTSPQYDQSDPLVENLYNLFMFQNEPDLMLTSIPMLDQWYKEETATQRKKRWKGYEKVLALFDERFHAFVDLVKENLLLYKNHVLGTAKKETAASEKIQLENMEHSFDDQ